MDYCVNEDFLTIAEVIQLDDDGLTKKDRNKMFVDNMLLKSGDNAYTKFVRLLKNHGGGPLAKTLEETDIKGPPVQVTKGENGGTESNKGTGLEQMTTDRGQPSGSDEAGGENSSTQPNITAGMEKMTIDRGQPSGAEKEIAEGTADAAEDELTSKLGFSVPEEVKHAKLLNQDLPGFMQAVPVKGKVTFASSLGFSDNETDTVEIDDKYGVQTQLFKLTSKWIQRNGCKATVGALLQIFLDCGLEIDWEQVKKVLKKKM